MTRVGPSTHILIVDDDRLILSTLAEGLRKGGYRVSEAGDAAAARELAGRDKPDLALLDVRMPGGSGIELAQDLASEHCVPFIFLSAYDDPAIIEKATELGALGNLVKPLDLPQIIPSIEAALARAAQIRSLQQTSAQSSHALEIGREISIAVGILMERRGLTREAALEILRSAARSRRRRMQEIAESLIQSLETVNTLALVQDDPG